MKYLRSNKGFTLVELAIVLVIIGIILGAVLKGQDLIEGAKIKKFIAKVKAWEIAQWTYYDRKGRFAGDSDKDGLIGKDNSENVKNDLTSVNFIDPPYEGESPSEQNTITIGSQTFYVFFGNDSKKNIMVICGSDDCDTGFTAEQLNYIESLDSSIDGVSDGANGRIIGSDNNPDINNTYWKATFNSQPTATAWSTNTKAAVYYFESKK